MVVVKVRETYDLCTVKNKMTVIAIHTPKPDIIKRNFPGLLMQCKAYRPLRAEVKIACASVQPLDPLGVGTAEGDVAPEDVFNPILYKAMTNIGMSQLEARIAAISGYASGVDVEGSSASVDVDSNTSYDDEFNIYYGLLSDAHGWRHASAQSGLVMSDLRPLVYELLYSIGDNIDGNESTPTGKFVAPLASGQNVQYFGTTIRGNAKPLPFMNCTAYSEIVTDGTVSGGWSYPGFNESGMSANAELTVPWINCCVAGIVIPPSRLHQLFYRMVVTWDIEFSSIRSLSEITDWAGLNRMGSQTHYQNYDYSSAKKAVTGTDETILESDTCMVSSNVDVKKVM